MQTNQLTILIERYLDESITAGEKALLATMLQEESHGMVFQSILLEELKSRRFELEPDAVIGQEIRHQVKLHMQEQLAGEDAAPTPVLGMRRSRVWYWTAASAILLAGALATYLYSSRPSPATPAAIVSADVPAGREGAVLTLADGTQLVLDTVSNGKIAEQNGSTIIMADGAMTYKPAAGANTVVSYNTMTTPKGRQFAFTLPDGTQVWLNAGSSITYPTGFSSRTRQVSMTGKAYFEVAKDVNKPFIVSIDRRVEAQVLGTSFNINAYNNETDIRTTLVEGMLKVKSVASDMPETGTPALILRPGQQAVVPVNGSPEIALVQDPDINKITAWKKGLFNFEGSSLVQVMKELERWYDIEVVYEGKPPAIRFYGKMGKDLSLKDLLEALDKSKVKFELQGKKLIVQQ